MELISSDKLMILNGDLKEGEALPLMRLLAKELRISIITTKRAYEELEREGYIESFTGKLMALLGYFLIKKYSRIEEILEQ